MRTDEEIAQLQAMIATLPLDQACLVVVSELRSGVLRAQGALQLLTHDAEQSARTPLSDEQRQQFTDIAARGVQDTRHVIDRLLVEGLFRRLKDEAT